MFIDLHALIFALRRSAMCHGPNRSFSAFQFVHVLFRRGTLHSSGARFDVDYGL